MPLVLSRKEGQSVTINGDITVTIAKIRGNQVRLAVKAPRHVPVVREEITPKSQPDRETFEDFRADGSLVRFGAMAVLQVAFPGGRGPIVWGSDAYCYRAEEAVDLANRLAQILQAGLHEPANPDAGDLSEVGLRVLVESQARIIQNQVAEIQSLRAQLDGQSPSADSLTT
jgi:carbon storage regulator